MKIEVLHVAECPYHPEAVKLVKDVLAAQGVAAEIQEVLVRDERMAKELSFLGSPTIRESTGETWCGSRRMHKVSLLLAVCTLDRSMSVFHPRK